MTADQRPRSSSDSVEVALERARDHARVAMAESIRSLRALLDAVMLAFDTDSENGSPAVFASFARQLDGLERRVSGATSADWQPLFEMVMSAIDGEVRRWETRSGNDPNARAVLRAYLSFRELLWEVGARGERSRSARGWKTSGNARPSEQ